MTLVLHIITVTYMKGFW